MEAKSNAHAAKRLSSIHPGVSGLGFQRRKTLDGKSWVPEREFWSATVRRQRWRPALSGRWLRGPALVRQRRPAALGAVILRRKFVRQPGLFGQQRL